MIPSSPSPLTAGGPRRKRNGRPATAGPYRIRPAQAADVAPVAAIERAVFSDPWSANDFTGSLAAGGSFLVAVVGRAVAGYAVAHCAADEGEILNLGVAHPHRGGGAGRALVAQVLETWLGLGSRVAYVATR